MLVNLRHFPLDYCGRFRTYLNSVSADNHPPQSSAHHLQFGRSFLTSYCPLRSYHVGNLSLLKMSISFTIDAVIQILSQTTYLCQSFQTSDNRMGPRTLSSFIADFLRQLSSNFQGHFYILAMQKALYCDFSRFHYLLLQSHRDLSTHGPSCAH